MSDVIVDEIRRVREKLINQHGGIDGYFKYCRTQDRAMRAHREPRRRKPAPRTHRKSC